MTRTISATFIYSGMSDYWSGDGRRWDDDAGCLFAYYGPDTTVRDLVDEWVNDYMNGGDCDSFPDDISADDVRAALLDMLSEDGRRDYESGALSDLAQGCDASDDEYGWCESPVAIVLLELSDDAR